MKKCSKCGVEKPHSEFGKEKRNKDGRRSDCKACYKIMRETWLSNNPNYFKEWHEENSDYRKTQYDTNKQRELDANKKWRQNNKEKLAVKMRKVRQQRKNLPYSYTKNDWITTLKYFNNKCAYCQKEADGLHQDHFIPAIKGGAFIKSNIVPACHSCNASKKDRDFSKWYRNKPFYDKEQEVKIFKFVGVKNNIQQLSIL